jgi:hypothetical protein
MPERHRHQDSTKRRKLFTTSLESCSPSAGIRVHDAVETVITVRRNMHSRTKVREDRTRVALLASSSCRISHIAPIDICELIQWSMLDTL